MDDNDPTSNESKPEVMDDYDSSRDEESWMPALMTRENSSDEDSWGSHLENNSDNSDVPYGDMVRGSETYGELERYNDDENENSDVDNDASNERSTTVTEVYDIDNIHELVEREGEQIRFPTTNSDEDSIPSSLDPYPEAYRLTNFALRERFFRYQHDAERSNIQIR